MGTQGLVGRASDQARIRKLEREREDDKQRVTEAKKEKVGFRNWHVGKQEVLESAFKQETIGLVSKEEYVTKRATIEARLEAETLKRKREEQNVTEEKRKQAAAEKLKKRQSAKLSFLDHDDDDDDDEECLPSTTRLRKDVTTRTDFLPDANRERRREDLKAQLKQEWRDKQEALKLRELPVLYSYWDGAGHKRCVTIHVGDRITDFLKVAREQLAQDFREMRHVSVDNLILVKDNVMLPQALTFYELIVSQAHGAGPLATVMFTSPDDGDDQVEGDAAHAAKVVERHWYERTKHIFPANCWEQFDADMHMKTASSEL